MHLPEGRSDANGKVVHRDLKLENFLYESEARASEQILVASTPRVLHINHNLGIFGHIYIYISYIQHLRYLFTFFLTGWLQPKI